jgi:hypothetical protein
MRLTDQLSCVSVGSVLSTSTGSYKGYTKRKEAQFFFETASNHQREGLTLARLTDA